MSEYVSGNIFIRAMTFEALGSAVEGHKHNFDHTTYVVRGAVQIDVLDDEGNVLKSVVKKASDGFNWVLIKAGVLHRLTALEDNTHAHCIYSHRGFDGEVVEAYDGWGPAYV